MFLRAIDDYYMIDNKPFGCYVFIRALPPPHERAGFSLWYQRRRQRYRERRHQPPPSSLWRWQEMGMGRSRGGGGGGGGGDFEEDPATSGGGGGGGGVVRWLWRRVSQVWDAIALPAGTADSSSERQQEEEQ